MDREQQLAEAFVGLADTLADDFDPIGLLDRLAAYCVDLTGADEAGIMMATARAACVPWPSPTTAPPCSSCSSCRPGRARAWTATAAGSPSTAPTSARTPTAGRCLHPRRYGWLRAAHALPLRVGRQTIGAVNLLLTEPGELPASDLRTSQALADVAALALVQYNPEPTRPADILSRAQTTLSAKAAVEIASGMLAEHAGLTPTEALRALRAYCSGNGGRLTATAQALVGRQLDPAAVLAAVH